MSEERRCQLKALLDQRWGPAKASKAIQKTPEYIKEIARSMAAEDQRKRGASDAEVRQFIASLNKEWDEAEGAKPKLTLIQGGLSA